MLGAMYGAESLENENRETLVNNFKEFLNGPLGKNGPNTLVRWCPQKVSQLVHDAVVGSGNNPLKCGTS
jgi:hypothetical protein